MEPCSCPLHGQIGLQFSCGARRGTVPCMCKSHYRPYRPAVLNRLRATIAQVEAAGGLGGKSRPKAPDSPSRER
jgi:hypothetical protein